MRIPSLRYHKATERAVVRLNGIDHYLGNWETDKKSNERQYRKLIADYLSTGYTDKTMPSETDITVSEFCLLHRNYVNVEFASKPSELSDIKLMMERFRSMFSHQWVKGKKEARLLATINETDVQKFHHSMVKEGLTRGYIKEIMRRFIRMWRKAKRYVPDRNYLEVKEYHEDCVKKSDAGKESRIVLPVDPAVVERTLPFLPPVVADMVRLHRLLGCRGSELCDLTRGMIDTTPDVNGNIVATLVKHKTARHGHSRKLYFNATAQAILAKYMDDRGAEDYLFSPAESEAVRRKAAHEARVTPLNCGNKPGSKKTRRRKLPPGNKYDRCSYGRAIARACEKNDIPHWSPHQIRHMVGNMIVDHPDGSIELTTAILGHSGGKISERYAKVALEKKKDRLASTAASLLT